MNLDCGHHCCHIRTNSYHVHAQEPGSCDRCLAHVSPRVMALTDQLVHAGTHPLRQAPAVSDGARRTTSTATASS